MIPNIFVSSTIADLAYLRDGLREAILELAYNPVMSEYGEVGYINPETAAESCYRSVRQCQMAVIIVGCRYGALSAGDKISVTQKEFRTARDSGIPTVAFVEHKIMHFKDLHAKDKNETFWGNVDFMDNPSMTFSFLDEIKASKTFNGLIPFTHVSDAKKALKLQIAHFVGESLNQIVTPIKDDLKVVLAEIMTLRQELASKRKLDPKFMTAIRYIIDEKRSKGLRYIIEHTVGPIDEAVPLIFESQTFDDFIKKTGAKLEVSEDVDFRNASPDDYYGALSFGVPSLSNPVGYDQAHIVVYKNKVVAMNNAAHGHFDWSYHALKMEIGT